MGDSEVSNLLIVEGKSDKDILESLINHINNLDIELDSPICQIDKCERLGGMGELEKKLNSLERRVKKESISKIGIIFDADKIGIEKRSKEIKEKIDLVFPDNKEVEFLIHIININGKGELEDILKKITVNNSIMADCLYSWQDCLKDKKLDEKEFNKLWIQVYEKYDCCSKKEQENMKDNCNKKILLESKKIYNFDADIKELKELIEFLKRLGE